MGSYFSGTGDDGYTGLLGEGRVPKYHLRPETYGTLDEASAALGLARASTDTEAVDRLVRSLQRDLYHLMAEVAAPFDEAERFRVVDQARVAWLEDQIASFGDRVQVPKEFILGGDTLAGAAFDLARTVVRRAERLVVRLHHGGHLANPHLMVYLNRLSSLCFVLSLWENKMAGIDSPSLANDDDR